VGNFTIRLAPFEAVPLGEGRSEELIKGVIAGQRDRAFVVSKVEANQVTGNAMARACDGSLARLGTDHLDLYLLHFPVPNTEFSHVVAGFETLRAGERFVRGDQHSEVRSSSPHWRCRQKHPRSEDPVRTIEFPENDS
jgi:aryl-alcohol dehydrogenase-like predicted oxidoreductase